MVLIRDSYSAHGLLSNSASLLLSPISPDIASISSVSGKSFKPIFEQLRRVNKQVQLDGMEEELYLDCSILGGREDHRREGQEPGPSGSKAGL
jgi:hypothetical protein